MKKHKGQLVGAPAFPSLYAEGKKGGGYDVKIPLKGTPVFLQFKLSDILKTKNAKEHATLGLKIPYFRMHLRPLKHSQQHQLLLDLENTGEAVYYIAPAFYRPKELDRYYLRKNVIKHSAAFSPIDIGTLPDSEEHYVVFEKNSAWGYRCSNDPTQVKRTDLEAELLILKDKDHQLGVDGLALLSRKMLNLVRGRAPETAINYAARADAERIAADLPPWESAGYLARNYFASELIIVG